MKKHSLFYDCLDSVPNNISVDRNINSDAKIGVLVSDEAFDNLKKIADVCVLTEQNYQPWISSGLLSYILINASWECVGGHWKNDLVTIDYGRTVVEELIELAKQKSIPVVFWFDTDECYFNNFFPLAQLANFICTYTQELLDRLIDEAEIQGAVVPIAIGTHKYTPIKNLDYKSTTNLADCIIPTWAGIPNNEHVLQALTGLKKGTVDIIERQFRLLKNYASKTPEAEHLIKGNIKNAVFHEFLKYYKHCLLFDDGIRTAYTNGKYLLEAICSGTQVRYLGTMPHFIRQNLSEINFDCDNVNEWISVESHPNQYSQEFMLSNVKLRLANSYKSILQIVEKGIIKKNDYERPKLLFLVKRDGKADRQCWEKIVEDIGISFNLSTSVEFYNQNSDLNIASKSQELPDSVIIDCLTYERVPNIEVFVMMYLDILDSDVWGGVATTAFNSEKNSETFFGHTLLEGCGLLHANAYNCLSNSKKESNKSIIQWLV